MADPRVEKLAKLVVHYSVEAKKNKTVMIGGPTAAAPLIREIVREVLRTGAHPMVLPQVPGLQEIFFEEAKEHQLKYTSPFKKFLYKNADCVVSILAEENTRAMSNVPGEKLAMVSTANTELQRLFMERSAKNELLWCGLPFPTNAMAQEASMSLSEYERFVYAAVKVDKRDPIAEWKKVKKQHERMIKRLEKASKLQFLGEDTDLKMSVKGRKWINCCGERNLPDGEVFSAPVENSVEGRIRFTFPGIYMGKEVEDITLEFKKGKVTKASAAKGQDLLNNLLGIDGARRLGEVAIGTNTDIKKFTKSILFDEKLGGTIHMAIGAGYPETGAKNVSAIHWDMIKDMKRGGEVIADGETVYKNGKWLK